MSDTRETQAGAAGHTPGPWTVDYDAICANGQHIGFAIGLESESYATQKANAARIVACVNACEGISTEDLESIGRLGNGPSVATNYAHMERDRDALRAECARLREALEECVTETPGAACYNTGKKTRRLEAINETVRAALTGARP